MQISDDKSKMSVSSLAQNEEKGEITSPNSAWKSGSDQLFVTCLDDNSENKIGKEIKITWIFLLILV